MTKADGKTLTPKHAFDLINLKVWLKCGRRSEEPLTRGEAFEAVEALELTLTAALAELAVAKSTRVLSWDDSFCPRCGHDRDTSSVSSIDLGNDMQQCQKCYGKWKQVDFDAARKAQHD